MGFKERLTKEWLFWDGGTGSVLQSWGLQAGELPETWNIIHPEKIVELNKLDVILSTPIHLVPID